MSAFNGLRGLVRAPWDAPDTSAADEAADLAAAAHQAQCDADDAAADAGDTAAWPAPLTSAQLVARARAFDRKALDADDAGRPLDADRYRRRALLARRASVPASLRAIGGAR